MYLTEEELKKSKEQKGKKFGKSDRPSAPKASKLMELFSKLVQFAKKFDSDNSAALKFWKLQFGVGIVVVCSTLGLGIFCALVGADWIRDTTTFFWAVVVIGAVIIGASYTGICYSDTCYYDKGDRAANRYLLGYLVFGVSVLLIHALVGVGLLAVAEPALLNVLTFVPFGLGSFVTFILLGNEVFE